VLLLIIIGPIIVEVGYRAEDIKVSQWTNIPPRPDIQWSKFLRFETYRRRGYYNNLLINENYQSSSLALRRLG